MLIEQQRRAIFNRLETQSWVGRTQCYPYLVKLHPFEQIVAIAYKNKIMVNDWAGGVVTSYMPSPPSPLKQQHNSLMSNSTSSVPPPQTTVMTLEFINSHDKTLILAGYDDGCIRIWQPPSENQKEPRLITAWQAMANITTNKFQSNLLISFFFFF